MRGENLINLEFTELAQGSSPHARGKLQHQKILSRGLRLIPACAGKTLATPTVAPVHGAHPRMRGENRRPQNPRMIMDGSSPHARGKLRPPPRAPLRGRLIPACAGKTLATPTVAPVHGAHPRMRGENCSGCLHCLFNDGSSPHARGKRSDVRGRDCGRRLIPACAGKTSTAFIVHCSIKAHPRMRGENGAWDKRHSRGLGSSPHARGKRVYPAIL